MNKNAIVETILIILAILAVEFFRSVTGIPVTILDLILFPMSLLIVFFTLKLLVKSKDLAAVKNKPMPWHKRWGYFVFSLLLILLGLWAIVAGLQAPFHLFTGVKGAAHGYSLVALGLVITVFSIYMAYLFGFKTKSARGDG